MEKKEKNILKNFIDGVKKWLLKMGIINEDKHLKIIEQQNKEFDKLKEKENHEYLIKMEKIEKEKKNKLKEIEDSGNDVINKSNEKYRNLFEYLNSIKDDKEKIMEFFNSVNYPLNE